MSLTVLQLYLHLDDPMIFLRYITPGRAADKSRCDKLVLEMTVAQVLLLMSTVPSEVRKYFGTR